jgi:hypothetical protein
MKRSQSLVVVIALTMVLETGALADSNQYLCIVEHSTGLHYDPQSKAWGPQAFGGRKYIMRRLTDDDRREWRVLLQGRPRANWVFFEFGDKFPTAICEESTQLPGRFDCLWAEVSFDKETNRFERIHRGAFIDQGFWEKMHQEDPERYGDLLSRKQANDISHPDDIFLEIGKCSPF